MPQKRYDPGTVQFSIDRADDGTWITARGQATRTRAKLRSPVKVRLGLGDDGSLIATAVLVAHEDGEVTSRDLRIPLAEILAEFASQASRPATFERLAREFMPGTDVVIQRLGGLPGSWLMFLGLRPDAQQTPDQPKRAVVARTRPGKAGIPDDKLREFVRDYKKALKKNPRAPIRELSRRTGMSEPTIYRWLRKAREKGFH